MSIIHILLKDYLNKPLLNLKATVSAIVVDPRNVHRIENPHTTITVTPSPIVHMM